MDTSMLEKDALVALLEKLKELASQERGEGDILESAAEDVSELAQLEGQEDEGEEEIESLPLFAADEKPPMRKRTGMMLGGGGAPSEPDKPAKKGYRK